MVENLSTFLLDFVPKLCPLDRWRLRKKKKKKLLNVACPMLNSDTLAYAHTLEAQYVTETVL